MVRSHSRSKGILALLELHSFSTFDAGMHDRGLTHEYPLPGLYDFQVHVLLRTSTLEVSPLNLGNRTKSFFAKRSKTT